MKTFECFTKNNDNLIILKEYSKINEVKCDLFYFKCDFRPSEEMIKKFKKYTFLGHYMLEEYEYEIYIPMFDPVYNFETFGQMLILYDPESNIAFKYLKEGKIITSTNVLLKIGFEQKASFGLSE